MSANAKREIGEIAAPYGRRIKLDEIAYDSGMVLLRLTIREGGRYTILEIDSAAAALWGQAMTEWAQAQGGEDQSILSNDSTRITR